jgi:hypothetical protein
MSRTIRFATAASLLIAAAAPAAAPQFETPARVAFLLDLSSGATLYAKNADARMPPASMAKMMTAEVARPGEVRSTSGFPKRERRDSNLAARDTSPDLRRPGGFRVGAFKPLA